MATPRTARTPGKRAASARSPRAAKIVEPKETRSPTQDQIAKLAYEIWIANGCREGHDLEHWCEAEAKLTLGC